MLIRLIALLIGITQAHAQTAQTAPSYIIFPSQAACLVRSKQMCAAMGCDGVNTIYWWDCNTALKAGTARGTAIAPGSFAMRVEASGMFGPTASNSVSAGTQGLTPSEQSGLLPPTAIGPLLPPQASGAAGSHLP